MTLKHYIMQHTSYVNQRADQVLVTDVEVGDDGLLKKDVEYYTIECNEPDCDGVGRYDERGDIICDQCGMMLGGEPVIPTEHGTGESDDEQSMEPASRGLGKTDVPPIPDPSPRDPDEHNHY